MKIRQLLINFASSVGHRGSHPIRDNNSSSNNNNNDNNNSSQGLSEIPST
jgi:hypothetical protein